MLTSTFTLVALSVEQTAVRAGVQALAERLHALPEAPTLAHGRAVQLCAGLRHVYDQCHWRKLDKFLVPVLRRGAAACDALLGELDALSREAAVAMAAAQARVDADEADGRVERAGFHTAAERCLAALRCRLEREEHELFPLARGTVANEAWFAIANQLLAHDAHAKERRGMAVSHAAAASAVVPTIAPFSSTAPAAAFLIAH
jgi:hemerythrin-like domain-containing protein